MPTLPHETQPRLRLDRRKFLTVAGGLVAAGLLPRTALALTEPARWRQGDWTVSVIDDGTLLFPLSIVTPDAPPEVAAALLGAQVEGDMVRYPSNTVLLQGRGETVLIDSGTGPNVQETAGDHLANLRAAGVAPEDVTKVLFTHVHPDHLWGAVDGAGTVVFPNATFHLSQAERDFWRDEGLGARMPAELTGMVNGTQARLAALAERSERFTPGDEPVPGVTVLDTSGHTPGHVSFEVDGGEGLIVVGDVVITPSVFFANPDWRFGFDTDGDAAVRHRRRLLDRAAADGIRLIGYHWPAPGVGRAEARGDAFVYVPV